MIAIARQQHESQPADWHNGFLKMLPAIHRQVRIAFCRLTGEAKEDAVCEVIANSLCAYRRLHERNELHRAFASVLVRYAVALFYNGRRVGTRQNSRDLYSEQTRLKAGVEIHSCGTPRDQRAEWMECLVDNRRTSVPDQVHFRVEFPRWLVTQTSRNRQIVERLSLGYSTAEVARQFKISPGRVSQLRMEFYDSWNEFSGEKLPTSVKAGFEMSVGTECRQ
jgi:DNA-directed RNA polymerase specialized sigma24 family protein